MDTSVFNVYAFTSSVLGLHLLVLAFLTGGARAKSGRFVNPEDKGVVKGTQGPEDSPEVQRFKRAHVNALENAVPFFVVAALYVATGGTKVGAQAYCYTFLAARLLHSVFYLLGKQPFRTMMFAIGAMATIGMAVQVIRATI